MTAALEGGEWSAARPGRTLPPGKSRYPFYRRLGGSQGRSGRAENLVPTGIWSRNVQPVVSRYTDWATGPTIQHYYQEYKTYSKVPSSTVIREWSIKSGQFRHHCFHIRLNLLLTQWGQRLSSALMKERLCYPRQIQYSWICTHYELFHAHRPFLTTSSWLVSTFLICDPRTS